MNILIFLISAIMLAFGFRHFQKYLWLKMVLGRLMDQLLLAWLSLIIYLVLHSSFASNYSYSKAQYDAYYWIFILFYRPLLTGPVPPILTPELRKSIEAKPTLQMRDVREMREEDKMTRTELGGVLFDKIANDIKVINLKLL